MQVVKKKNMLLHILITKKGGEIVPILMIVRKSSYIGYVTKSRINRNVR